MGPISPIPAAQYASTPSQPVTHENLSAAASTLNSNNAFGDSKEVVIKYDDHSHRYLVQVVDKETKEVVRQLAPPTIFLMAKSIGS